MINSTLRLKKIVNTPLSHPKLFIMIFLSFMIAIFNKFIFAKRRNLKQWENINKQLQIILKNLNNNEKVNMNLWILVHVSIKYPEKISILSAISS